jgi:nucleoside transporter
MELLNTNPALATLRLTLMMFVQYLSMGAALSTLGLVLGTHGMASTIAATFAVGGFVTIFSPVLIGMVADRFVPAQILLIGLNVVCALALLQLPSAVENHRAGLFLVFMGLFYSCFVPASAVANRIAFHSIGADKKRFTLVRTCGTLGFMAGALLVGQLGISSSVAAFRLAAAAAFVVAAFSIFLPHTPPGAKDTPLRFRELFGLDAFILFKDSQYRIFILCTVILFIPMMAHLSYLSLFLGAKGYPNVGSLLTIGQFSELVFMTCLAFLLVRLGYKKVLLIAAGAWLVRMTLFSYASGHLATAVVILGIALHGVAWDFFFVTGEIYSNDLAPIGIKTQAQGLWKTITFGLGVLIGSIVTGAIFSHVVVVQGGAGLPQWSRFWLYPAGCSAAVIVILAVWFRGKPMVQPEVTTPLAIEYGMVEEAG